jgi:thioredoxin reductase (NADPH)
VYLSNQVAKVWLIVRGPSLALSMSRYLVARIASIPNIEILAQTTVDALEGQDGILALLWQKFSQGYAELNHLRQCGQREGRARVM